jgi:3-oxoacyl-[acyl-carrier-protein] synthase-1
MKSDIVVVASAMATPVGLNTAQSCAAVRAGIGRFEELLWKNKEYRPFVMSAIPDNCLPELTQDISNDSSLTFREKRMIQLAILIQPEIEKFRSKEKLPLILGFPYDIKNTDKVFHYISTQLNLDIDHNQSRFIAKGRTSGLMAVHSACKLLKKGQTDIVIAGGCDTYKDINLLGFLNTEARLKSEINLDGFIPGEGVCFLCLTTRAKAQKENRDILCVLKAFAAAFEKAHFYSKSHYKGEGLSNTFQSLFDAYNLPKDKITTVYSSMNGESYWIKEWGISYTRFKEKIEDGFKIEHPAEFYGDPGAASGPLMIAQGLTGMQRGYKMAPVLVYSSSDHGERAAVILTKE